jgi:alkylhydroperoxidase family enzyme
MRSKLLMGLILAFWQFLAAGQVPEQPPQALDAEAERQHIAQERADREAVFLKAERECYSRFAVSDCLRTARKDRRLAMDELRRQELVLNDMDRQTKALEVLKRIDANLAVQQQQQGKNAQPTPTPR